MLSQFPGALWPTQGHRIPEYSWGTVPGYFTSQMPVSMDTQSPFQLNPQYPQILNLLIWTASCIFLKSVFQDLGGS